MHGPLCLQKMVLSICLLDKISQPKLKTKPSLDQIAKQNKAIVVFEERVCSQKLSILS